MYIDFKIPFIFFPMIYTDVPNASVHSRMVSSMNSRVVNTVNVISMSFLHPVAINAVNLSSVEWLRRCRPVGIRNVSGVRCVPRNWPIVVSSVIRIVPFAMNVMQQLGLRLRDVIFVKNASKIIWISRVSKLSLNSTKSSIRSGLIDDEPLRFRGEVYHGYHFNCTACGIELDSTAREVKSRPGLAANDMVWVGHHQIYTFSGLLSPLSTPLSIYHRRMNCIACVVTIKWEFQFVVPVVVQLRREWSQLWVNIGMWRWVEWENFQIPNSNSLIDSYIYVCVCVCLFFVAFCLCQMWETFPRSSSLRETWFGLLWESLSSTLWKSVFCLQSGDCRWWYENMRI